MSGTGIPYCDETWDLTIGCRKRSEGCANCWATWIVHRLACRDVQGYGADDCDRLRQTTLDGRDWEPTDHVNLLPWNLEKPLHWRQPRFVFVNSKSDLFDERVPFEYIERAFDVMAQAPQHRFMVLTKEPERMAEFLRWYQERPVVTASGLRCMWPGAFGHAILMVSVESANYMVRVSALVETSAAMHGVSFEPLLTPISSRLRFDIVELDWVVIGCEKLLGGRPGRWATDEPEAWWTATATMVQACRNAGVACWVKQGPTCDGRRVTDNIEDFPESCRVQQKPKGLML